MYCLSRWKEQNRKDSTEKTIRGKASAEGHHFNQEGELVVKGLFSSCANVN